MVPAPPDLPTSRPPRHLLLILPAVFLIGATVSLLGDSATFDETAHLPAGFTYLDRGDFRLNPEHPPLAKAWAALPVWLLGLAEPDYHSAAWTGIPLDPRSGVRSKASQWRFGFELLNGPLGDSRRRSPGRLLVPARLAMLLPALLLLAILYAWSRELWGEWGGLLSLFLGCLSPTLLAHAGRVTTDLPTALGFAAVLWSFWRFTRRPTWNRALICGLCCAGALLVKFSALLLGPILALAFAGWVMWPGLPRVERRKRLGRVLMLTLVLAVFSYAGIWAGYGFDFPAANPGYALDWEVVGLKEGPAAALVHGALEARLLPEGYLYGLAYFLGDAERRVAFLNGEQSLIGWWYYFPQAFLMKTPPATILLLAWLALAALASRRRPSFGAVVLVAPIVVYVGVSMIGNLNIGHRHLLPIYPLLFVLCGGITRYLGDSRLRIGAVILLMAGCAVSFAAATPRYLSYFNVSAGGASGGWRYLLDSNIDWGQDLKRLAGWMEREGIDEIDLAYFGTADPAAYGIRYRKVLMVHDFRPELPAVRPTAGRHVAVSVNLLQGLYFDRDRAFAEELHRRGWITNERVKDWIELRDRLSREGRRHPDLASWAVDQGIVKESQRRRIERGLLSHDLQRLRSEAEQVGRAGDSIYIFLPHRESSQLETSLRGIAHTR